eukprot:CAMPEP_0118713426 /NCGR_PEP_ID=MMETSP0800-20121206/25505_1 /TAXON_ID=210618 ORGANISM="Striatella unipunctata, Strain CCMP2910" /NCGR_SAMPLE_ID=MMETSP0800 /ASSEMBLY_ACC=CAM_ASM_000638 /LENGTH=337 /DNA_ID=CAMNT_0006618867 /DNA_START=25 /DNA_END=1038 /DNA_ORIENTATION=+
MIELSYIHLDNNRFTGELPESAFFFYSCVELTLSDNDLRGPIPQNFDRDRLYLVLGDNRIENRIDTLNLKGNRFSGNIPEEFAQRLTNLRFLDLSQNLVSGKIPDVTWGSSNLEHLYLDNNKIQGAIPKSLPKTLQSFTVTYNTLTSTIPTEMGLLTNLERFEAQDNFISGGIPTEIGALSNLMILYLGYNRLDGTLPTELGQLSSIKAIIFKQMAMTGTIPKEYGNWENVWGVDMSGNKLEGTIPTEFGKLTNMQYLLFRSNLLTGRVPSELGKFSDIRVVSLDRNFLVGSIPSEICNLTVGTDFRELQTDCTVSCSCCSTCNSGIDDCSAVFNAC